MGRRIVLTPADVPQDEPVVHLGPRSGRDVTPTVRQQAIIDAFGTGKDIVVDALAGSGKTSVLRMLSQSTDRRGVYFAHNKSIAEEAKASFPPNVAAATGHSLAFRALGYRFSQRLNGPRMPAWKLAEMLGLPRDYPWRLPMPGSQGARLVMETIDKFCQSADERIGPHHVPFVNGLQPDAQLILREKAAERAQQAWDEDITQEHGRLPFTHDNYLRMWVETKPVLRGDFVLLDEAQDANALVDWLVRMQPAQKVLVGDQNQQLYAWRGAIDSMKAFDGVRLPLEQSFRFGPAIADEANCWLDWLGSSLRVRGYEPIESTIVPDLDAPAAILCRTNAATVAELMRLQAKGVKATLVGSAAPIRALALAAMDLLAGKPARHPELFMFKTWSDVEEYAQHGSGSDLRPFVRLINQHGPGKVVEAIECMVPASDADVVISTAHRAKGLEWPTVLIGPDFQGRKNEHDETPPRSEMMLSYVAVTRAKERLCLGSLTNAFVPKEQKGGGQ